MISKTKNNLIKALTCRCRDLTYNYNIRIKYKFSDFHDTFLIQYFPGKNIDNESFIEDLFKIQNELNEMFGDDAPLFSRGNELFRLIHAEEIKPLVDKETEFCIRHGGYYNFEEKMKLLNPEYIEEQENSEHKEIWDLVKELKGFGL